MEASQSGHRRIGESGLVQRVRARLEALPIPGVPTIVVGLSGGVDSLALAGVLAELARQGQASIIAVHVDHRLRPESSDEQAFVADQAEMLGVEIVAECLSPGLRERHRGVGLEEAARRERFSVLAKIARHRGADAIALAHHESDQAETVLLHLLRGTGSHGIRGMAEWSLRTIPWWVAEEQGEPPRQVAVWRPFISETKPTLELYVDGLGVTPIFDPSNASGDFKRNRIRHELMPLMEEISPGSTAALVRYSQLAAAEDSYLAAAAAPRLASLHDDDGRLSLGGLSELDVVIQRRIIRAWLQSELPAGVEVGQERVDAVRALGLSGHGGSTIQIGSGWQVVRSGAYLRLERNPV